MTLQEAIDKMAALHPAELLDEYGVFMGDAEIAHVEADKILVAYLQSNGAEGLANAFNMAKKQVGFWYA